jgi:hypothetical protein
VKRLIYKMFLCNNKKFLLSKKVSRFWIKRHAFIMYIIFGITLILPISASALELKEKDDINYSWNEIKLLLLQKYAISLKRDDTYSLYEIGDITSNVLFYIEKTQDPRIIESIVSFYLEIINKSEIYYFNNSEYYYFNNAKYRDERILHSSQFLYGTVKLYRLMHQFGIEDEEYFRMVEEVIIKGHLWRWIFKERKFHRNGWKCTDGFFTNYEHLQNILQFLYQSEDRKSYCNVFRDDDLWIAASAAEYLISQYYNLFPVGQEQVSPDQLVDYVEVARKLLQQRYYIEQDPRFPGFRGQFEYGAYNDIYDYKYAKYEYYDKACSSCIMGKCKHCDVLENLKKFDKRVHALKENVGWDIAHARRVVPVFMSFMEYSRLYGKNFPNKETLAEIARQLSYVVWNGDVREPRFANYFDGSNGWYRVGYNAQENFGYPPYSRSEFVARAGYGILRKYDPRLSLAMNSMYCKYRYTRNGPLNGKAWNFMLSVESLDIFGSLVECRKLH